ncbi:hypothetical protein BGZ49_004451 [Haplosporangium sp. Z 27]|nr:hypothetical protein BGZ49_004451 [Haplosporangium sp. Z 27]
MTISSNLKCKNGSCINADIQNARSFSKTDHVHVRIGQCGLRKTVIKEIFEDVREPRLDLMTIRDQNIIQFYHHNGNTQVMEFAEGGSLADNISRIGDKREEIARQINSGLAYLHRRGIIHNNISASNILLTEDLKAKIAGFGSTNLIEKETPELQQEQLTHAYKSDIYALGRIMREMGEGSLEYMQLMRRCLDEDPDQKSYSTPDDLEPEVLPSAPEHENYDDEVDYEYKEEYDDEDIGEEDDGEVLEDEEDEDGFEDEVEEEDMEKFDQLVKLAKNGDAFAQRHLGIMYLNGCDVPKVYKDEELSFYWIRKSAGGGDREAQNLLGLIYLRKNKHKIALEWFEKSAGQGHCNALVNVGNIKLDQGLIEEAKHCYLKALLKGDESVQSQLTKLKHLEINEWVIQYTKKANEKIMSPDEVSNFLCAMENIEQLTPFGYFERTNMVLRSIQILQYRLNEISKVETPLKVVVEEVVEGVLNEVELSKREILIREIYERYLNRQDIIMSTQF